MSDSQVTAGGTHEVTIFHNPSCSQSRGALGILQEQAVDYRVVEYLDSPPARETLQAIVAKLVDPVPDLVRTTDKRFVEAGFDPSGYRTPEAVIEFLLAHPELMQRPIVVKGDRAIIGRPSERVVQILG